MEWSPSQAARIEVGFDDDFTSSSPSFHGNGVKVAPKEAVFRSSRNVNPRIL